MFGKLGSFCLEALLPCCRSPSLFAWEQCTGSNACVGRGEGGTGEERQQGPCWRAQLSPQISGPRLLKLYSLEEKIMQNNEEQKYLGKIYLESLANFEIDLILNYICTYCPVISFRGKKKRERENLLLECNLGTG